MLSPVSTGMGDRPDLTSDIAVFVLKRDVKLQLTHSGAALYFGTLPATQVDSAFYPLWNSEMIPAKGR